MTPARTALRAALVALPVALCASAVSAAPALASGSDDVRATGSCTAGSAWELKTKPDDGQLEVEFEVDSNVVGQSWRWRLLDDGVRVAAGPATTTAPSGSFTVQRRIAGQAGPDVIRFRSTNPVTGEVCTGRVTV